MLLTTLPNDNPDDPMPQDVWASYANSHIARSASNDIYNHNVYHDRTPKKVSGDSCAVFSYPESYSNHSAAELGQQLLEAISVIRKEIGVSKYGGTTAAFAIRAKDGIAFMNCGDAIVTLVGDIGVKQITLDQIGIEHKKKQVIDGVVVCEEGFTNCVRNAIGVNPENNQDSALYYTYDQIEALVGKNARVLIQSDGIYSHLEERNNGNQRVVLTKDDCSPERTIQITQASQSANEKFLSDITIYLRRLGYTHDSAEYLLALIKHARLIDKTFPAYDDIGIVSMPATPPDTPKDITMAVVCDAIGGQEHSWFTAQTVINRLMSFITTETENSSQLTYFNCREAVKPVLDIRPDRGEPNSNTVKFVFGFAHLWQEMRDIISEQASKLASNLGGEFNSETFVLRFNLNDCRVGRPVLQQLISYVWHSLCDEFETSMTQSGNAQALDNFVQPPSGSMSLMT